jgi:uncharacterized membrane protein/protein-disulfide isomerase
VQESLTLNGKLWPRVLSFIAGVGMIVASVLTVRHFFAANFPESIFEGSFCDINAFFNCDSSAFAMISQIGGVPLGYFGIMVGGLVILGLLFPSLKFERTNMSISLINVIGVIGLLLFSVFYLGSLCLLCAGYYVSSILSFIIFYKYGADREEGPLMRHSRPSLLHLVTFGAVTLAGAYGFARFHAAKEQAQTGVATHVIREYYNLPRVESPSTISPFMIMKSTEEFDQAPIQVIEYVDFLCPDCLYLNRQMDRLKEEFKGKINIAFQFFPLDAKCNTVVDKDRHPGACDLSYIAAHDPSKFLQIHDEIFANFRAARNPQWRLDLARRYGVEGALEDPDTKELVHTIINTGAEYEKTSDEFAHGIRSTPTMIVNNRMIIGTLPYQQLRAIFQTLVDEHERGEQKFMENWEPTNP